MNVLFLSWAYPKKNTPYLGIWAHQQALALTARGVDVEVVSAVPYVPHIAGVLSAKVRDYALIPDTVNLDGVKVHHPKLLRTKPNSFLDRFLFRMLGIQTRWLASSLAKKLDFGKYQVLHAHNLFPDGAIAYQLHRRYGIPYVLTLHDVDRFNSFSEEGYNRVLSRAVVAEAKKVFVVSSRVKRNLTPDVPEQRLELLFNTFWTQGHATKSRRRRIVLIASMIERKGVHYLLQAFSRVVRTHADYELILIGGGRELPALMRMAEQLGIDGQVTFTGMLSHGEAMERLSEAAVFCLPSWDEAFGIVYAEAMSFGIPVIGCKGEGIEDIVTHGDNGLLVEPRNAEALEAALLALIEHPEDAVRIGLRGQESVRSLQPEAFGRKLAGIYEEVVGGA
ncbi:glycosyltransferase [Cohnella nanjingensis]|uniref:Glycosyltransferase n=1 Tax=Cohnella nanjingensis TaxID=1387779 RepID=A0A7X0RSN5_9BACL|nr:glycosyltransferase [Cohnella nanjingensis]MBB6671685.1 glycosyltransferase [Cohnella nanjingensis]